MQEQKAQAQTIPEQPGAGPQPAGAGNAGKLQHPINFLKGFLMGMADVVPGVSGGTIALLTGIYPRLIHAVSAPTHKSFWNSLFRFRVMEVLRAVDAAFLAAVGLGILGAVVSMVNAISYLLKNEPHLLLGLFFGLVLASAVYVCTLVREYKPRLLGLTLLGLVLTFLFGTLDPTLTPNLPSPAKYFFSGIVSISAMLMPGISGSLLLVNMGMYGHVVEAARNLDPILFVFAAGALVGLLGFSRIIKIMLARIHDEFMAVICGILLASLYLIWPWKQYVKDVPLSGQPNLLPQQYSTDADVLWVGLLFLAGMALVGLLQFLLVRGVDSRPEERSPQ